MKAIYDFGFWILDCRRHSAARSRRANPKSKIQNPKFPRRSGASILEVLFAILVTTVGLLGALAVFPVASAQARKGRIAEATGVAGRTAVHAFDARGMRRPDMWVGWSQSWDFPTPPAPVLSPPNFYPVTSIRFPTGTSFCIDPRFVSTNNGSAAAANAASVFPYHNAAAGPRMFRIGLTNGVPGGSLMSRQQAESIFTISDDLTFDRTHKKPLVNPLGNEDRSLPAEGLFSPGDHDLDPATPERKWVRSSEGKMSWIATLVPKHELYAPGVVANDLYVLSIVIFYDRPLVNFSLDPAPAPPPAGSPPDASASMYNLAERVVAADFADAGGTGYSGGETVLIWPPNGATVANNVSNRDAAARMLKVRTGDWIMLSGFVPSAVGPLPIFKWYRVTEADNEPEYHPGENHYEVAVSLTGADWDATIDQQATIVSGVVGVYEKTVRLETGTGF